MATKRIVVLENNQIKVNLPNSDSLFKDELGIDPLIIAYRDKHKSRDCEDEYEDVHVDVDDGDGWGTDVDDDHADDECRIPPNITLYDWRAVNTVRTGVKSQQVRYESRWKKPSSGRMKCNIDASFSSLNNRVGIGVCIRDEFGAYVLAKYEQFTPLCDVRIGEAFGLLSALNWVHELNLGPVDFELDSKIVVDSFHSNKCDVTELGDIISHCKRLFSTYYKNSSVEFIKRQANEWRSQDSGLRGADIQTQTTKTTHILKRKGQGCSIASKGPTSSVHRQKDKELEEVGGHKKRRCGPQQQAQSEPEPTAEPIVELQADPIPDSEKDEDVESLGEEDFADDEGEEEEIVAGEEEDVVAAYAIDWFGGPRLASTGYQHLDSCLISAFAERWHEETSSFHMPVGENTVTLNDVSCLLHLPLEGRLLDHSSISKVDGIDLMVNLL
ncbi:hypothetical protein TSUD_409300 [Trifolium subterraneum]|uniref:RNase H type-1 domain-containing protein n=1 Tax=Trifolium subterraneum TaxID=3900 RepID=A0A2Z6PJ22_TRISU|nr:hypothetical protein TSUD_409300 [Trifolium subterraneum]